MNRFTFLKTLFAAPAAVKILQEQVKVMPGETAPVKPPVTRQTMGPQTKFDSIIACSGYFLRYD